MNQSSLRAIWDGKPFRIHYQDSKAVYLLSQSIRNNLVHRPTNSTIVVLCIGTDRSTGDSLGPLIGTALTNRFHLNHVYGTLDSPVHAVNLVSTLDQLSDTIQNPFYLAVDACLGHHASVGEITFSSGSLRPGAGVNKKLPEVGHYHITGVVNVGGFMEYLVLQNTRLNLVYQMAEVIANGVFLGLKSSVLLNRQHTVPDPLF